MKQVSQNLRSGELTIEETPAPARPDGFVLVATRASLISSGTERATVQAARASLLGKARQRPDKVRQVIENLKREGLAATIAKVRDKLDRPKALGYSSAGVVIETDPGETLFREGDRVACGGAEYAVHAETVVVPRNLAVPLPERLSFEEGSFAGVGAIALQGVRRARVEIGERVLVIGLGLIGQLVWQLLERAGCLVIGTDVSEGAVETAAALGLGHALLRGRDDVEGACAALTGGQGVDAVLIAASGASRDPVELAGAASREGGRVVILGDVSLEIPREPHFYRKELDVVMSRSYGPGRYDPEYEEGGTDYPYGFVRWTEGRNMAAFLEAAAAGGVRVAPLITHRFPIERAEEAYRLVSGENPEPHLGIVLTYDDAIRRETSVPLRPVGISPAPGTICLGVIGAGSFARSHRLTHLRGRRGVERVAVATARGATAADAALKFDFAEASTDAAAVVRDPRVGAVLIATRHDLHARLAQLALESGKHVFVEKPLATNADELAELLPVAEKSGRILQVGFNRRFSPLAAELRRSLETAGAPAQITYRVNAGPLPSGHWLLDPREGGGRIVGEACHFIDLMGFLTGELPSRVSASRLGDDAGGCWSILVELSRGSTGVLVYQANGPAALPKERIEVFAAGRGGILDDWKCLEIFEGRHRRTRSVRGQAKGYAEEIDAFVESIRTGRPAISLESLAMTTAATFAILESITTRQPAEVALPRQV